MKQRSNFISGISGKRKRIHLRASEPEDLQASEFDGLFDTSESWEEKARKLQVRRWRQIKHQLS